MQTIIDILTTHRDMLPEGASCTINAEADPEHAHGMSAGDEYYRRPFAPEQVGDDVEARGQAVSIHYGDRVLTLINRYKKVEVQDFLGIWEEKETVSGYTSIVTDNQSDTSTRTEHEYADEMLDTLKRFVAAGSMTD